MNGTLDISANGTVYSITVGNGGAVGESSPFHGFNGQDSSFGNVIVAKGGGGGSIWGGRSGGSGGGGGVTTQGHSGIAIIKRTVVLIIGWIALSYHMYYLLCHFLMFCMNRWRWHCWTRVWWS